MARVTIRHGAQLDIPNTEEIAALLGAANARDIDERAAMDYWNLPDAAQLNGSGAAGPISYAVPAQFDWLIERLSIGPTSAGDAGIMQLYRDGTDPASFLGTFASGAANGAAYPISPRMIVPANAQLVVVISGGGANNPWAWNFQIRRIRSQRLGPTRTRPERS